MSIVLIHTPRSSGLLKDISSIGRFSTPLFSMLAAFFLVRHFRGRGAAGVRPYLRSRITRLAFPFVAWSVIYLLSREMNWLLFRHESQLLWITEMARQLAAAPSLGTFLAAMEANHGWALLWAGTSYHLWFLPYLLVMTLVTTPLVLWSVGRRSRELAAAGVLVALGLFMSFTVAEPFILSRFQDPEQATFAALLYHRSPSFLWGIAIGLLCRSGRPPRLGRAAAVAAAALALLCLGVYVAVVRHERLWAGTGPVDVRQSIVLVRVAAALIFLLALSGWAGGPLRRGAWLGGLSYGVYLSHVLVIESLHSMRRSAGVGVDWRSDLVLFAGALAISLGVAWAIRSTRWTRWLVP